MSRIQILLRSPLRSGRHTQRFYWWPHLRSHFPYFPLTQSILNNPVCISSKYSPAILLASDLSLLFRDRSDFSAWIPHINIAESVSPGVLCCPLSDTYTQICFFWTISHLSSLPARWWVSSRAGDRMLLPCFSFCKPSFVSGPGQNSL